MELMYVTIVVLASMIFVLSGMVGYLYWQQTRMLQNLQSLASVVSTHFTRPTECEEAHEHVHEEPDLEESEEEEAEVNVPELPSDEDDRVSVEHLEGPPKTHVDVDDIQTKTAVQLREILTAKGIPYGKRDSKTVLLQLLKATA
jgi:hypothetical protein